MLVSFVIVTYNRQTEAAECLESVLKQSYRPIEVIIIDNCSAKSSKEMLEKKLSEAGIPGQYVRLSENKGVGGGRNEGILRANGDVIIFIDDDAVFTDQTATARTIKRFEQQPDLGVLAFRSINYYTGQTDPHEFPHPNKSLDYDKEVETTYYIGVGHAVRSEVFEKAGLYPPDLFYGMTDFALMYQIINHNYTIIYDPSIAVYHKVSPSGRLEKKDKIMKKAENKIKIAILNLPVVNVFSVTLLWSLKYLIDTRGNLIGCLKMHVNVLKALPQLFSKRKVIKRETCRKIRKLGGYLYH